jgi:hypothetical protein
MRWRKKVVIHNNPQRAHEAGAGAVAGMVKSWTGTGEPVVGWREKSNPDPDYKHNLQMFVTFALRCDACGLKRRFRRGHGGSRETTQFVIVHIRDPLV